MGLERSYHHGPESTFIAEYMKDYFPFNEFMSSIQYQQEDRLQVGRTLRRGGTQRPCGSFTKTPSLSPLHRPGDY